MTTGPLHWELLQRARQLFFTSEGKGSGMLSFLTFFQKGCPRHKRKKIGNHDFNGMHCDVLTVNFFVVSVAIFRVLGCEVAEMPLVATCKQDQGMGYFQSLFWCIQRTLSGLGVKHFLVSAATDAESYWRNKFGFEKISQMVD